jgi:hypothetical protein
VFLRQEVILPLSFPVARDRLLGLAYDGSLSAASGDAFARGATETCRVGPLGEIPGFSKLVRVRFADPSPHDDRMIVPLRWEATGPTGRLFPVLDADFTLLPADCPEPAHWDERYGSRSRLILAGSYRPPLDGLGVMADKMVMHRLATATLGSLLHKIAGELKAAA